jgi:DNA-directed RNA polymerase II subunit RPB1
MNIFFGQSIQAQTELELIADVKYQIMTPQSSAPIISIKEDALVGSFNMTGDDVKLDWRTAMNILSATKMTDYAVIPKNADILGKVVYSTIIPKKINMFKGDATKTVISVKNGEIVGGRIVDAAVAAKKKNNLIQLVLDEYGVEETVSFINNITRLVNNFNLYHGMTVGIGDLDVSYDLYTKMYQVFKTKKLEVTHEITEVENNPDMMDEELLEITIKQKLDIIRDDIGKIIFNNFKPNNNFKIMNECGSKGSILNIGQMGGCVGNQDFQGDRMPKSYNGRTLPYFFKNDDGAEARGFIEGSFLNGLNLSEFIFHHITGREGLIDQALKTASSGYLQRKFIKATEDFMVKYDGTVRNAVDRIEQFIYGDSGIDTVKQYDYKFKMMEMSNEEMSEKFKFTKEELKNLKNYSDKDNESFYKQMLKMRDHLRQTQLAGTMNYLSLNTNYMLPVNINRIIDNTKNSSTKEPTMNDPEYIIKMIEDILLPNKCRLYSMTEEEMNNKKCPKYIDDQMSKTAFKYALYESLAPKKCITLYKFSVGQLESISKQIISSFNRSVVEPGEMVGILGAQSLGEPVTQMVLNVFHNTGIGGANLGVPRLQEVFSLSKNIKAPFMMVYLDKEHRTKKDYANKIASYVKFTTIKDLRSNIEIYYDPKPYDKDGFMEKDNVYNIFYAFQQSKSCCLNKIDGLPWLMRIEFDKEKMMNKEVCLLDIKSKFCVEWEKRFQDVKSIKREKRQILEKITQLAVLTNTDNDTIPTMHIRFDMTNFNSSTLIDFMDMFIDDFKLKGMANIEDIANGGAVEQRLISFDNPDGSLDTKQNEYMIYTKGINMQSIRNIIGVDLTRTYCNDIISTYEMFGIDAARNLIIKEITSVFAENGSAVNHQHVSIFGDLMTNVGSLTSVDRHGLNKLDTDPLARASFEKTVEQLITAAVFNEVDHMKSVSSRIMAGLCIKGGTGLCNLILDKDLLENSEYTTDIGQLYKKTYDDIVPTNTTQDIDSEVFIPNF